MKYLDASTLQEFYAGRALRRLKPPPPGLNQLPAFPPCPVSPALSLLSQRHPKLQQTILPSQASSVPGHRPMTESIPRAKRQQRHPKNRSPQPAHLLGLQEK